jgi:diaminopimelate epimerase
MIKIPFTKMHALGNNYIYVNAFSFEIEESSLEDLAIKVSSVYTGIGSDGMILICPSVKAPVKMRIFNNDGSEGKNCGNGLRCVAKYAFEHGIVKEKSFNIETLSGLVHATVHEEDGEVYSVTINMGTPILNRSSIPMIGQEAESVISESFQAGEHHFDITAVSMGNPHCIIYVDDISNAPVTSIGPLIEKDARFPEGVNVEFVEVEKEDEIHFRVWERGSGVTQACGTGACAAVVSSALNGKTSRGVETTVHLAGGDLYITWAEDGDVYMTGPAEVICNGEYLYK